MVGVLNQKEIGSGDLKIVPNTSVDSKRGVSKQKLIDMNNAKKRYSLSDYKLTQVAEEAGALCRIGKSKRIDVNTLDAYINDKFRTSMPVNFIEIEPCEEIDKCQEVKIDRYELHKVVEGCGSVDNFLLTIGRSDKWYTNVDKYGKCLYADVETIELIHGINIMYNNTQEDKPKNPVTKSAGMIDINVPLLEKIVNGCSSKRAFGNLIDHSEPWLSATIRRGYCYNYDIERIKEVYGVDITLKKDDISEIEVKEDEKEVKEISENRDDVLSVLNDIKSLLEQIVINQNKRVKPKAYLIPPKEDLEKDGEINKE